MNYRSIYTQQVDESDCGAASLSMILKYYHSNISLSQIRESAQTDKNGTTALGMIYAADRFNLTTDAIQADMSIFETCKSKAPFILHVDKELGLLHYIVVLEVRLDGIMIADPDPSVKIRKMSFEEIESIWTGVVLFITPGPHYVPINSNKDSLFGTAKVLFKYKSVIIIIIIASFLSTIISIIGATFIQEIVDSLITRKMLNALNVIALSLSVAYIFHGLLNYLQGYLSTVLAKKLSLDILLNYIKHLFVLPIPFFKSRKTGELISRFEDANNIIDTVARTTIVTILNIATISIISIYMCMISIKLFLFTLITLPIYAIIILTFTKKFDKLNHSRMEGNADLSSELVDDIAGIETIKSLNAEEKMVKLIQLKFNDALNSTFRYGALSVLQNAIKDSTGLLLELGILYFGSRLSINDNISVGQLIAFNAMLGYFTGPVEDVINLQNEIQTARVANIRLNQVLFSKSEKELSGRNIQHMNDDHLSREIKMKHVSFEYKYGRETLHDINLVLRPKESVVIVGQSGSGKSTLMKLIIHFIQPTQGNIYFGKTNIGNIDNKMVREQIAYLSQTPYIFAGSVRENLSLGSQRAVSQEELIKAAKIVGIDDMICQLPDGYETNIASNSGLSGGQLQQIAIARVLISDAKTIILDESTSNLDPITEKKLLKGVLTLKDKTVVFVAHRMNIAKQVDRILVMDKGKIVEDGTHQELIRKRGNYFEMVKS